MRTFLLLIASFAVRVLSDSEDELSCENPISELSCYELSIKVLTSKETFFTGLLGVQCTNLGDQMNKDDEKIQIFESPDGGHTLNAECPDDNYVISKMRLCLEDRFVTSLAIHCNPLEDPEKIEDVYNVTSDEYFNLKVDCGDGGALQKMYFMDAEDSDSTRVVFTCAEINTDDD